MTEPLCAYVVGMQWSDNRASIARVIATKPEEASAIAVVMSLRGEDASEGGLIGVLVHELPLNWLHMAVKAVESGRVAGDVVKLVQSELDDSNAQLVPVPALQVMPPTIRTDDEARRLREVYEMGYEPDGAA